MTTPNDTGTIRITCAPGLLGYLKREVEDLGYAVESSRATGLEIHAGMRDAMRLNIYLRTAFNVLWLIDDFSCTTPTELYERTASLPWEEMISPDGYLSVVSSVNTPTISDWRYASLKVKDAIVDRVASVAGRRPDSGPQRDRFVIHLYWNGDACQLYLNTSGRKLADRSYRRIPHKAPMQETLAAAVILATGYDGSTPLVNPMCGSGTLAIEAALIATGRPPGLLRGNFGFMHDRRFDDNAWQELRREAKKVRRKTDVARIIATDHDEKAIWAARKNAETAGVHTMIDFEVCDFAETPISAGQRHRHPQPRIRRATRRRGCPGSDVQAHGRLLQAELPRLDRVHLHRQPRSGEEGRPPRQPPYGVLQREDRLPPAQVRDVRGHATDAGVS